MLVSDGQGGGVRGADLMCRLWSSEPSVSPSPPLPSLFRLAHLAHHVVPLPRGSASRGPRWTAHPDVAGAGQDRPCSSDMMAELARLQRALAAANDGGNAQAAASKLAHRLSRCLPLAGALRA